jgi:hypothetical protein
MAWEEFDNPGNILVLNLTKNNMLSEVTLMQEDQLRSSK